MDIRIDTKIFNKMYIPYIMDYTHRYEVYKGSAGSGKSYYCTQKVVIKSLKSKRKVLFMRKVGATIKDSVWQLTLDVLEQFKILNKCKINVSNFSIELPNGSVFLYKSIDNPEKIKSITGITDIFVEECTEFSIDDISQLDLRLRAKVSNLQMFFCFNPISKANYTYSLWKFTEENQTQRIREYDDTIIFCSTYKDNRFLPESYINSLEAMKETNYTYYQIYCLGLFCTLDKLVFPNYKVEEFDYRDILKKEDTIAIFGLDFGYVNDPSALICVVVDEKNKILYVYDEMYEKGLLNNEIADKIKKMGISKEIIIADCAEKKSIDEMRKCGISRIKPCKKGKGSINHGLQKISQYRIIIHPKCVNAIVEIKNYTWKKDKSTGEYINEAIDSYNHLIGDSFRYAMQSLKAKGKILTVKL